MARSRKPSMTADDFRRLALACDGAIEREHMGHPDFRANGRIFASIYHDHERGMVKLTPDQQRTFIHAYPDAFEPASGAWGRQGCTTVMFEALDEPTAEAALALAWQGVTTKPPAKPRSKARR